jgi:release factor glutamine methyltransferase
MGGGAVDAEMHITIKQALQAARLCLLPSETAASEARRLLSHVLGRPPAALLAYPETRLTEAQHQQLQALVARRAAGEPLDYLLGYSHFYDLTLTVTPDVLIPRPETELLVEQAIHYAQLLPAPIIADIGTGSGAIAVTAAAHLPQACVHAVDISAAALQIAEHNAQQVGVEVTFWQGSLGEPLIKHGVRVDLLLANLPYIASAEVPTLPVSRYEPVLALDGGEDGLTLIRELLRQAPQICRPGALLLLEIGSGQGRAALEAAAHLPLRKAAVLTDYAGHERILRLQLM